MRIVQEVQVKSEAVAEVQKWQSEKAREEKNVQPRTQAERAYEGFRSGELSAGPWFRFAALYEFRRRRRNRFQVPFRHPLATDQAHFAGACHVRKPKPWSINIQRQSADAK